MALGGAERGEGSEGAFAEVVGVGHLVRVRGRGRVRAGARVRIKARIPSCPVRVRVRIRMCPPVRAHA